MIREHTLGCNKGLLQAIVTERPFICELLKPPSLGRWLKRKLLSVIGAPLDCFFNFNFALLLAEELIK